MPEIHEGQYPPTTPAPFFVSFIVLLLAFSDCPDEVGVADVDDFVVVDLADVLDDAFAVPEDEPCDMDDDLFRHFVVFREVSKFFWV